MMNWDQIKSNWKQVSDKIKLTWGKLSEDDLAAIAGERDLLSGLLQQRYGYAKAQAETKVDDFAQRLKQEDETHNAAGNSQYQEYFNVDSRTRKRFWRWKRC